MIVEILLAVAGVCALGAWAAFKSDNNKTPDTWIGSLFGFILVAAGFAAVVAAGVTFLIEHITWK